MPLVIKMSEAKKIQEAVEKVREILAFPDKNPFREYWRKDNRYSLIAQLFHTLSSENVHPYSLPDAWGEMMNANRAHLVIMLREAGAGHDPFRNAEWSSTPAHVWENLAQMEQLPDLKDADLTGANLSNTDLRCASLMETNLQDADLRGAIVNRTNLTQADLTGANMAGVNLRSAYLDEDTKLDGAIGLD